MIRPSLALLSWLALAAGIRASPSNDGARPNFVLIMTDDQDKLLNSVDYQPAVQKHFIEQGTAFEKHFCTMAQCCPSRVNFLTGRTGHNTNVTDVAAPYGKTPRQISRLHPWLTAREQEGTPSLCHRDSTATMLLFGCRRRDITPTTRASS